MIELPIEPTDVEPALILDEMPDAAEDNREAPEDTVEDMSANKLVERADTW